MQLNVRSFSAIYNKLKQDLIPRLAARYFRPPYGIVGARTRQRLAYFIDDPYIVNWSVDIADWLYANSSMPEMQLKTFERDVKRGGDLVVMHYLNPSTVSYFRDAIRIARATGKQIMRVDQCMGNPYAPPLPDHIRLMLRCNESTAGFDVNVKFGGGEIQIVNPAAWASPVCFALVGVYLLLRPIVKSYSRYR